MEPMRKTHRFVAMLKVLTVVALLAATGCTAADEDVSDLQQRCMNVRCSTDCPADSFLQYPDLTAIDDDSYDEGREKRSIAADKSEKGIKITPMDNLNVLDLLYDRLRRTRSIDPSEQMVKVYHLSDTQAAPEDLCCPRCICAPCAEPQSCPFGYKTIPIPPVHPEGQPGSCCPQVRCQPEEATCYSDVNLRYYRRNETWNEGACSSCRCRGGEKVCETPSCMPLHCEHKKELPGLCCPVCDEERSIFCREHLNCDLNCLFGYERRGNCALCACSLTPTVVPTVNVTTSVTTEGAPTFEQQPVAPEESGKVAVTTNAPIVEAKSSELDEENFFGTTFGMVLSIIFVLIVLIFTLIVLYRYVSIERVKMALKVLFSCNQISKGKSAYNRVSSTAPVLATTTSSSSNKNNTTTTINGTDNAADSMA